ncbi:Amino_acid transporter family protein [Hexamita inflata]|uniref:Amino_acid transporter family protein n=1 Tax=Hexamita inflata TaxID=28002 RepID=A0ABP1JWP2_9EUKA
MSNWKYKQILTTQSTLISQMMGASLLSIAFIVNKLDWVIALSLHVFTILCDVFMYKYYIDIVHYTQAGTYRQLTEKALSKKLSLVLDISICVFVTNYIIISSTAVINFIQTCSITPLTSTLLRPLFPSLQYSRCAY